GLEHCIGRPSLQGMISVRGHRHKRVDVCAKVFLSAPVLLQKLSSQLEFLRPVTIRGPYGLVEGLACLRSTALSDRWVVALRLIWRVNLRAIHPSPAVIVRD